MIVNRPSPNTADDVAEGSPVLSTKRCWASAVEQKLVQEQHAVKTTDNASEHSMEVRIVALRGKEVSGGGARDAV
jgi:hypothetical protein